ncbi:hypothetical protein BGZ83_008262 [Gryganskiella cystojenkinii]|nr:hypothetical protein BGZ83_008262 [Gryganskiella cystojenkinii]
MKYTFTIVALSAPALVASICVNRDFGYGVFSRPCDCLAGYTIYENSNCGKQSEHITGGGWTTSLGEWPVKSYECDVAFSRLAYSCVNHSYGVGTFSKPNQCTGGYTIFQSPGCMGGFVHFNNGGWTTSNGDWPVQSFRCDEVCNNHL